MTSRMSAHTRTPGDTYGRRDLARFAIAGLAAPLFGVFDNVASGRARSDVAVGGVRLGVHSSSFRDAPNTPGSDTVDTLIQAMTECDVRDCGGTEELLARGAVHAHGL